MTTTQDKIRLLVVDDSLFFREWLARSLSTRPEIELVGVAADAFEAGEKFRELKPDIILLDMELPKMRGAEFLRRLRPGSSPTKVVVISSIPNNVFEALNAGAVDFVPKPQTRPGFDNAAFLQEAVEKIKVAATSTGSVRKPVPTPIKLQEAPRISIPPPSLHVTDQHIIAIGASTGGTEAILAVIKDLPETTPAIVMVQHMPPGFTDMFAKRLDKACRMSVREARNGDRVARGLILLAPGDKHMKLRRDSGGYYVRCEQGEKVSGHCPSVDVLFHSVAEAAGADAVGVILTGMGADGAKGLLEMRSKGAYTFGQNKETCVVYGMPKAANTMGAVIRELPLQSIGDAVLRRFSQ